MLISRKLCKEIIMLLEKYKPSCRNFVISYKYSDEIVIGIDFCADFVYIYSMKT